jgi:hypothetical protein
VEIPSARLVKSTLSFSSQYHLHFALEENLNFTFYHFVTIFGTPNYMST